MAPSGDAWEDRIRADFRLFLILVWRHLGLPDPTPLQLSIAGYLQHGPDRTVIMAFRGAAKSWITAAYVLWLLWCDPQQKVLVVSGSLKRARAFTNFCFMLIHEMPMLQHLKPKPTQRQSQEAFDVGPAKPDQSPSFHASGITGQIVGFRADVIVPDDVETDTNSITLSMREKIGDAVKEFDSILKPHGRVRFLGTPHSQDSLYNKMEHRGYEVRVWPIFFPDAEQLGKYGPRLAPFITKRLAKDATLVGKSTEPTRFSMADLVKRQASLGRSEFALQWMLDTSLSDADRYPLKARDLIIMPLDPKRGPESVAWSGERRLSELPAMGFEGDYYQGPIPQPDIKLRPYNRIIGAVDSSGRGKDETALSIVAELFGIVFVLHMAAFLSGYDRATLVAIARACVRYRVQELFIEANFGDGMFAALMTPVLTAEWKKWNDNHPEDQHGGTTITELRSSNKARKELRMLSVLEPVIQSHRLVINQEVIEWDYRSLEAIEGEETRHGYAFGYQLTHLTREADSLDHEDRLEALFMGVAQFAGELGVDPLGLAVRARDEDLEEELSRMFDDADEIGEHGDRGNLGNQSRPYALGPTMRN